MIKADLRSVQAQRRSIHIHIGRQVDILQEDRSGVEILIRFNLVRINMVKRRRRKVKEKKEKEKKNDKSKKNIIL